MHPPQSVGEASSATRQSHPRTWLVDPTGAGVDFGVIGALKVIECEGLPWFANFSDPLNARHFVETGEELFNNLGPNGTWGFGRPGSSMRDHTIACLRNVIAAAC